MGIPADSLHETAIGEGGGMEKGGTDTEPAAHGQTEVHNLDGEVHLSLLISRDYSVSWGEKKIISDAF